MLTDAKRASHPALRPGQHVAEPVRAPRPARRGERASVWFTAYPAVAASRAPGESLPRGPRRRRLWKAFAQIGIDAVHTGPGQAGRRHRAAGGTTPSVDGHFDRISMQIDPAFGTEERVPHAVRDRRRVRRHGHRRHRARATPARAPTSGSPRWATPTTRASTTWSRSRPEDWHLLPDVPTGQRLGQPRRRGRGGAGATPATSSAACSG